jgi:hypothetical protein
LSDATVKHADQLTCLKPDHLDGTLVPPFDSRALALSELGAAQPTALF